jgi:glucosamine kinase
MAVSAHAPDSAAPAVVGIDIGGTKTHLALGVHGVIEREHVVRTSTWRTHAAEPNALALRGLIVDAFGTDALRRPIAVGAHGCDSTQQCLDLQRELAAQASGPVLVVNDAELMPPAMGVAGGVGLVAGTGSIAVARDSAGRLVTAGGWGWVLGDEGSSSGIVREAVRAVLGELDHGRTGDPLTVRMLAAFDATDGAELAMALTGSSSADWWGSHAEQVFLAADEGSAVAAAVIDLASAALAGLLGRLTARGVLVEHVVVGGAVIQGQARLRDTFVATVAATHPATTVSILDRPPVYGALALAGLTDPPSDPTGRAAALLPSTPFPPNPITAEVTP